VVRVRIRSRLKIRVRIRAMVEVRVRVRVRISVSYIMTIWRWEEFFKCDKFPTTPDSRPDRQCDPSLNLLSKYPPYGLLC